MKKALFVLTIILLSSSIFAGDIQSRRDEQDNVQTLKQKIMLMGKLRSLKRQHENGLDSQRLPIEAWVESNDIIITMSKGYFKTQSNFQNCDIVFNYGYQSYLAYYTQEQNMLHGFKKK